MRNSELMRRCANVSTLDLGRMKSDLEAIGEISQEGKKRPFILRLHVSFYISPPSTALTYLCTQNRSCVSNYHTYPHTRHVVPAQDARPCARRITRLPRLITASVVTHLLWVTVDTTRKCINSGICKEDRPSSSHVSAAALQHHNRTHLKF